ncbi:hypothetical protein KEM55_005627, partial [Ascosphaera atra]
LAPSTPPHALPFVPFPIRSNPPDLNAHRSILFSLSPSLSTVNPHRHATATTTATATARRGSDSGIRTRIRFKFGEGWKDLPNGNCKREDLEFEAFSTGAETGLALLDYGCYGYGHGYGEIRPDRDPKGREEGGKKREKRLIELS